MARKDLLRQYVWVIETILRRRRITFDALADLWKRDEISGGNDLPKRTFDNWRDAIWDIFQIDIANDHHDDYKYYISNEEDIRSNTMTSWLYSTLSVSNSLANAPRLKDRILLEYVPSGQDYLQAIIEAMKENRVLTMTYHGYWNDEDNTFDVQPYCVKLFRQRWYMVGRCTHPHFYEKGPRIYALDRIRQLDSTDETFELPEDWSADEYFANCFGIIPDQHVPIQRVKLKASAGQANYIRDLKLHESQEEVERNDEYSIFTYILRPTYDFMQEILRNGADIEVLEPQSLREEVTEIVQGMWEKYK